MHAGRWQLRPDDVDGFVLLMLRCYDCDLRQ